jgi:hypothetical protein
MQTDAPVPTLTLDVEPSSSRKSAEHRKLQPLWMIWAGLILFGFLGRLAWGYDADELQNLRFAWNIGHGQVPFRDFFEHHPPLFHYALTPFVANLERPDWTLLLGMRLAALATTILLLFAFYKLLRRSTSQLTACWGLGLLIIIHPFCTSIFEFRADWIALAALVGALYHLTLSFTQDKGQNASSALAGLLAGLGICLTQKTALLLPAVLIWAVGSIYCASEKSEQKARVRCMLVFLVTCIVPSALLTAWFYHIGALGALIEYTVRINLRWASEGTWRYTAQESVLPAFPVFILAIAQAVRTLRNIKTEFDSAGIQLLAALLFIFGSLVLLTTPVPHGQSFLFLIGPWAALLAASAIARYLSHPESIVKDRAYLGIGLALSLATLNPVNACVAIVVWGTIGIVGLRWLNRQRSVRDNTLVANRAFAMISVIGILASIGRSADGMRLKEGFVQARFIEFAEKTAKPGEPILQTWPLIAPFRRQASFHGFARVGPVQTIGAAVLEDEYIGAIKSGSARIIVVDDLDVRRQLPRLAQFLKKSCHRVLGAPATRDRLAIYRYDVHLQ